MYAHMWVPVFHIYTRVYTCVRLFTHLCIAKDSRGQQGAHFRALRLRFLKTNMSERAFQAEKVATINLVLATSAVPDVGLGLCGSGLPRGHSIPGTLLAACTCVFCLFAYADVPQEFVPHDSHMQPLAGLDHGGSEQLDKVRTCLSACVTLTLL